MSLTAVPDDDASGTRAYRAVLVERLRAIGAPEDCEIACVTDLRRAVLHITVRIPSVAIEVRESAYLLAGLGETIEALRRIWERLVARLLDDAVRWETGAAVEAARDGLMAEEDWAA